MNLLFLTDQILLNFKIVILCLKICDDESYC
jgi:hypothetical protein